MLEKSSGEAGLKKKTYTDDIRGETVELGSGIVLQDKLSDSSKSDSIEGITKQHSYAITEHHDQALGSIAMPFDGMKKYLANSYLTNKINLWQDRIRARNASERRLAVYFDLLQQYQTVLHLPEKICDSTRLYLRRLEKQRALASKNVPTALLSVIQISCKIMECHFDLTAARKAVRVNRHLLLRYISIFVTALKIDYADSIPADVLYFNKFCNLLSLKPKTIKLGHSILEYNRKTNLTGALSPKTVAATVVFIACKNTGVPIYKMEFCSKIGVTPPTMLVAQKRLSDVCNLLHLKDILLKNIANYKEDQN